MQVIVHNLDRPDVKPVLAKYCASFLCRLRGLTFRRNLGEDEGLLLVEKRDSKLDSSIHMLWVFFDLAVIWINEAGEVADVQLARKWRLAYVPKRPASFILEINPSRLFDFKIGDQVRFEEVRLG